MDTCNSAPPAGCFAKVLGDARLGVDPFADGVRHPMTADVHVNVVLFIQNRASTDSNSLMALCAVVKGEKLPFRSHANIELIIFSGTNKISV